MSEHVDLTEDAARLVSYGLRPTLRPAREPDYAELLGRYRGDGSFRELVVVVARGLGLSVLGETELGLVLGAEETGPFALRLASYRRAGLSVEERMCHGLIQLAIAAWCFPTARSLEEPDSTAGARVTVQGLVEYVVGLCQEFENKAGDDDAVAESPELQEAWRTVLTRAETRTTPDGRRSPGTLAGMIAHALEFLERGGLLRKLGEDGGGTWQALAAYRIQARELAAHELAVRVRAAGAPVVEGG